MVPFAGWNMPVQYTGIIPENQAVRAGLGVFDISHMGQIVVASNEPNVAATWLNTVLTNNIEKLHTDIQSFDYNILQFKETTTQKLQ